MLLKIISVLLMIWFGASAFFAFKGKKPVLLKVFGLVVYCFFAIGGFFLFRLDPSAQWILKTSLILYILLLILDGSFQYFSHWVSINQDRFPAFKQALAGENLSDDQKKKYHLMQTLLAKKQQGEDISVESRAELDQLMDEFEVDEDLDSEDIQAEDVFDSLEEHPELFEGMEDQIKMKMKAILVFYSFVIFMFVLLFFYLRSNSFGGLFH